MFKFFKSPPPFPGDRELIGFVYPVGGDKIPVHMPNALDLRDIKNHPEYEESFVYLLAAKSVGVPFCEFGNWPITTVNAVHEVLEQALVVLKPRVIITMIKAGMQREGK